MYKLAVTYKFENLNSNAFYCQMNCNFKRKDVVSNERNNKNKKKKNNKKKK